MTTTQGVNQMANDHQWPLKELSRFGVSRRLEAPFEAVLRLMAKLM